MDKFFQKRLRLYHKRMMKYMRYVFNDHFILVCMFLMGGLGLYYSQLIKTLPRGFTPGLWLVGLVWLTLLHFGQIATLLESADVVFLLPKERQLNQYLKKALNYSVWLPFLLLAFATGVTMPLIVLAGKASFSSFIWYVLMLWLLKYSHLQVMKHKFYQGVKLQASYLFWLATSGCLIMIALVLNPLLGLAGAVIQVVILLFLGKKVEARPLDWLKAVGLEENRLHRIYQFINLFTDVPEITAKVKRRKFLDPFLKKIPPLKKNTYLYLFSRRFLRGTEYSGLYLRLVFVGGLILYFLQDLRFILGIGLLFIYLIGFQLIPLYNQFNYMILTELYPVPTQQKQQALQKLILILLMIVAAIFALITMIQQRELLSGALTLGILVIGVLLFCRGYLPSRIKKMGA